MSLVAIPLKHKAPLRCRLHTIVFGSSISIKFIRCGLGCKRTCEKCTGCERNIKEIMAEGFREAFKRGLAAGEKHKIQIQGRL